MMSHRVLCVGPPGTGKTAFGISLVESAIGNGMHPRKILYTTFTKAGAYEARARALKRFPQFNPNEDFPYFRTAHSIAFRELGLVTGNMLTKKGLNNFAKAFSYQFSDSEMPISFEEQIAEMPLATLADVFLAFDEFWKNRLLFNFDEAYNKFVVAATDLPEGFLIEDVKLFVKRKEEYKREEGLWDFSDLLLKVYQDRIPIDIDFMVWDEMNDQSPLLQAVAEIWAENAREVYFLGDPAQCLFSWAGSDPSIMLDLKRDEDIVLRQSYRCPKAVRGIARRIFDRMQVRYHDSDFLPTREEGSISKVPLGGVDFNRDGSTFVMARTRYLLQPYYTRLLKLAIPFKTRRGWKSPLEKAEAASATTLYKLHNYMHVTVEDIYKLTKVIPQKAWLRKRAKTELADRVKEESERKVSIDELPALGFTADFIDALQSEDGYLGPLKISVDDKKYLRDLIDKFGIHILEVEPRIILGTVHSFKGLECDNGIIGLELTRRPYHNLRSDPDAEHRIFYVATTRCRKTLQLVISTTWRAYPL